jgi:hypothetical protein
MRQFPASAQELIDFDNLWKNMESLLGDCRHSAERPFRQSRRSSADEAIQVNHALRAGS